MQLVKVSDGFEEFSIVVDAEAFDVRGTFTVTPADMAEDVTGLIEDQNDERGVPMDRDSASAAGIQRAMLSFGYKVEVPPGSVIREDKDGQMS